VQKAIVILIYFLKNSAYFNNQTWVGIFNNNDTLRARGKTRVSKDKNKSIKREIWELKAGALLRKLMF